MCSRLARVTPSRASIWRTSATAAAIAALRSAAAFAFGSRSIADLLRVDYALQATCRGRGDGMALKATRNDVWTGTIDDRAGGAADVLETLAKAKVNLEMVFARRMPENPGKGLMIVGPIKGKKAEAAALAAGLARTGAMFGVRVEGGDKPGL